MVEFTVIPHSQAVFAGHFLAVQTFPGLRLVFVAHRTLDRGLSHKFQSAGGQFLDGKQVVIFIVFNSLVKSFLDSLVVLSPRETVCNFFGVFLTDCCDELSELFVNSLLILELHLCDFF